MNILYCGDKNIMDGLIISILSILKYNKSEIHFYIFTMDYKNEIKKYDKFPLKYANKLDKLVKKVNKKSSVKLLNITNTVNKCLPEANINTRFTPFCMLRLYADQIEEIPDRILYLDNDVVCFKNFVNFYNTNIDNYELTGALDYWGQHFYQNRIFKKSYLNSGVLLMNMKLIRKNNSFENMRIMCKDKEMLLPDQHALNYLCKSKQIVSHIYNDQAKLTEETVFRHFTTTFKFFPKFHTQTIKPWNVEELHNTLHICELDDILEEYNKIKGEL